MFLDDVREGNELLAVSVGAPLESRAALGGARGAGFPEGPVVGAPEPATTEAALENHRDGADAVLDGAVSSPPLPNDDATSVEDVEPNFDENVEPSPVNFRKLKMLLDPEFEGIA